MTRGCAAWLALWALVGIGCEPPPPLVLEPGATPADVVAAPAIEILNPAGGQVIELDETCTIREPLIVQVSCYDLEYPDLEPTDTTAHWHGGQNFESGFCMSWTAYCLAAPPVDPTAEPEEPGEGLAKFEFFDGSGVKAGLLTLFVQLHDDAHEALPAVVGDDVEVQLVDPGGFCG